MLNIVQWTIVQTPQKTVMALAPLPLRDGVRHLCTQPVQKRRARRPLGGEVHRRICAILRLSRFDDRKAQLGLCLNNKQVQILLKYD